MIGALIFSGGEVKHVKKVSSLLLVLMLAVPALACNFGATPPTATAPGAASNSTTAPTTVSTTAPSAAPSATPTTAPTNVPPTNPPNATTANTAAPSNTQVAGDCTPGNGKTVTTASELKIEDVLVCPGTPAQMGMTVSAHYVGSLKDGGAIFVNTVAQGQPVSFILGSNQVIKGLSEGIVGMTAGSKRRLTIPPILGYGSQGSQGVPANATLVFDIQLLSVK